MNVIQNLFRGIHSRLLLDCILLVQFVSCFFASSYLISYYFSVEDLADYYETVMDKNLYWIFPEEDIEGGGREKISELQSCVQDLRNMKDLQYMVLSYGQTVLTEAGTLREHMTEEEEAEFQIDPSDRDSFYDSENDVKWSPTINNCNVDWEGYQYLSRSLLSGREFTREDFARESREEITPVMMGADYAAYFQPGDRIRIIWTDEVQTCEVVGFLKAGSNAVLSGQTYLDSYILFPSQDRNYSLTEGESLNNELWHYIRCLYAWIVTEPDFPPNRVTAELNGIMSKYPLGNLGGEPQTFGTEAFQGELSETVDVIAALVILWLAFLVFSVLIILFHRIDLRAREYAILLMNGIPYRRILWGYLAEFMILLSGAAVLAVLMNPALRQESEGSRLALVYLGIYLAASAGILLLAALALRLRLQRMDIAQVMGRKE